MENKLEVYKVDDKGHSWKWVVRNGEEIVLYPTKKKAVQFVSEQIKVAK